MPRESDNRRALWLSAHDTQAIPATDHTLTLGAGSLDEALDRLLARLMTHAGDQLTDDMALVLIEPSTD